jgi:myosin heavy subunit
MNSFIHEPRQSILGGRTAQQKQSWSFPTLKISEILMCLNELGIPATEDDLVNPEKNKDQCRHILEQLAEICTGTTREEMNQPAFSGLSALTYPELHEESIPQINSFRACTRMMETCGIQDFTIKDFMVPNPKRLRKQLSGIINFAKFREERLVLLADLSGTRETLLEQMQKLKEKNESLNKRLIVLREQTEEESKTIARVETECNEIANKISSLNEQQAEIREQSGDLKNRNNQVKDAIASTTLRLEELNSLKKKLTSQIVNSPERFRKQIIDVGQALKTEQADAKAAERKVREICAWLANVEEAQNEVSSALDGVHDLKAEVDRQRAVTSDLDMQRQNASASKDFLTQLEQTSIQIGRQATRAEEKLQHLRRQTATRGADTQQAVDELHKQLLDAENFRSQVSQ